MSLIVAELEVKTMDDLRRSGFLTRSKGNDSELVTVVFNNGTSKPMRHARKRCLDEIDRWQKILRRLPTREDWSSSKNPKLFSLDTIDELFGSFEVMLDELAKRKQQPITWKKQPKTKVAESEKEQPPAPNPPVNPKKVTPKTSPKPKRKKRAKMTKDQDYSDVQLAEFVVRACGGKKRIARANYEDWREYQTESTPSSYVIAKRLGEGSWNSDMFERVHQLIDYKSDTDKLKSIVLESDSEPSPELESVSEPSLDSVPESAAESDSGYPPSDMRICPFVNLLNRSFKLGGFCFEATDDDCFAVVQQTSYYDGASEAGIKENYELKMALGSSGPLVDFPEFSPESEPDIVYLVDGNLYDMLPLKQRRTDLVPVYYVRGNLKPGLYIKE